MPNTWDTLPNAKHIDRVLAHLKAHPQKWDADRDEDWDAAREAAWDAAWCAAREAAWDAAWCAAREAAREDAWRAAWEATWAAAWDAAWYAAREDARDAVFALVAWDDCGYILGLPPDLVHLLVDSGNQQAILLYPAVLAMYEGD